jgi:hypothetical protein
MRAKKMPSADAARQGGSTGWFLPVKGRQRWRLEKRGGGGHEKTASVFVPARDQKAGYTVGLACELPYTA